jgi:VanZ family protein
MLQRIKKLLEHNLLTLAVLATIIIAVLSLTAIPKINFGLEIKSSDKILHILAYFTLSMVWFLALQKKMSNLYSRFFLIFSIVIYGIILEVLQGGITNYRTGDFYDVIANTIGVLLAVLLINKFISWFKAI